MHRAPTILSLNPCTDALLAQVADAGQIAGLSAYSRQVGQSSMDVALARRLPVSGGTLEESLVAHPAMVVTGGLVPGRDALITELLARTGFASFSAARGMRQADVLPLEPLLMEPPRVILVAAGDVRDGPGEDRLLAHPVLAHLGGVRRFALAPRLEWCGGPTIIEAAGRLAQIRKALGAGPATGGGA